MGKIKKYIKICMKLLPAVFLRYSIEDLLETTDWILKMESVYRKILKILPDYSLYLFLQRYSELIKTHVVDDTGQYERIKEKWMELFSTADDHGKMFMTKLFYMTGIFDEDVSRRIIQFAQETENKSYRYWTAMDISKMTFILQKGFYPEYYNDRKKILQKIATENNLKVPDRSESRNQGEKILVISYLLDSSIHNSMQRVAAMVANAMGKRFDEVMVLSLESFYRTTQEKKTINTIFKREASVKHKHEIEKMFNQNIKVCFADGNSFQERYQNVLDRIYSYNPSSIIDISDEFSAVSYFYSKDYFTYYLPLREGASSSFFNIVGGVKWKYKISNKKFRSIPLENMVEWSFPEYVPERSGHYERRDLGVKKDEFIIVSIGNNDAIFEPQFVDEVCSMLVRNEKFVWLLVGGGASKYLMSKYRKLFNSRRIIEWGFENNLAALCAACDVVLRPNTTGSSGATAIAAMQGLPIAMTNFVCDPMRWLGEDYSNIETYRELMQYIEDLASNKEFYEQQQQLVLSKVQTATNAERKWDELAQILNERIIHGDKM